MKTQEIKIDLKIDLATISADSSFPIFMKKKVYSNGKTTAVYLPKQWANRDVLVILLGDKEK